MTWIDLRPSCLLMMGPLELFTFEKEVFYKTCSFFRGGVWLLTGMSSSWEKLVATSKKRGVRFCVRSQEGKHKARRTEEEENVASLVKLVEMFTHEESTGKPLLR